MKRKLNLKMMLASLLVTAALVVPTVVLSVAADPVDAELIFQGAELRYCEDGSVQAIFDVAIDKVINTTGTSFHLKYNHEYLQPSYIEDVMDSTGTQVLHKANELVAIEEGGSQDIDVFFRQDDGLYKTDGNGKAVSVFAERNLSSSFRMEYYSQLDTDIHAIHMTLLLDQNNLPAILAANGGLAGELGILEKVDFDDHRYTLNTRNSKNNVYDPAPAGKVVLGQLSFRVEKDRVPEIVDLFDGMDRLRNRREEAAGNTTETPYVPVKTLGTATAESTFLLDIQDDVKDPYQINCFYGRETQRMEYHYGPGRKEEGGTQSLPNADNVGDHYIYQFKKDVIIKVEATNPHVVINAYQNFTKGNPGDLPISMGKYCPTVTVTYADGTKENVPFPWGGRTGAADNDGYQATYTVSGGAVTDVTYDSTQGEYTFSQLYKYTDSEGNAQVFPTPVTATLEVTPITVLKVTADDLEKTYPLETVVERVPDVGSLALPTQARIITDIVPAGVSLVTPIKGWRPVNGTWPDPATAAPGHAMNSLLAVGHAVGGDGVDRPYWPDTGDGTPLQAANHVGRYHFHTSNDERTKDEDILREDIKREFPWLTVPDPSYPLDNAKRNIVPRAEFSDPAKYKVGYVSTITATTGNNTEGNGMGQPELTLSVERASSNESMGQDAVFRIWLPNGLEIGTGQIGGGVSVEDWFGGTVYQDHTHGHYHTEGNVQNETGTATHFNLITNPGDPLTPNDPDYVKKDERETLRRFINLGGWYKVAICEDPNGTDPDIVDGWTDPIPVYVPPRRNEYQEDKIYNFIGENAALANWPGGVGDTLYLPRGSYYPVGPTGTAVTSGVGLPLYSYIAQPGDPAIITDGQNNTTAGIKVEDLFEDGDFHRPKAPRYEESYGVKTTYDGQTGAQPGEIFNVRVDSADTTHTNPWKPPTTGEKLEKVVETAAAPATTTIYKHGPTPLYTGDMYFNDESKLVDRGYQVAGFGYVHQPEADLDTYRATLRTQLEPPEEDPTLREEIRLVSYEKTGITRVVQGDEESNVTLATYDTEVEGYTVRQPYTFVIKNVGDVDIYGLDIDGLVDGYPADQPGGRFEMLVPPANFLPAGSSTSFVLTYVYDLKNNEDQPPLKYRDTLYITSNTHPTPGKYDAAGNVDNHGDYLLDFDAEFTVSKNPLHKVTVIYKPTDGNMGTAGLIVGEQGTGSNIIMNYTETTRTYPQKDIVYVVVRPKDEYEVVKDASKHPEILMTDSAGRPIKDNQGNDISAYAGTATLDDGTEVYLFEMPNQDVIVTVRFYEPLKSKLRLNKLFEFSSPSLDTSTATTKKDKTKADLVHGYYGATGDPNYEPEDTDEHEYPLWQKQFTAQEEADAVTWSDGHGRVGKDFYLMTAGSAIPKAQGGDVYDSSKSHYLVVIDTEDDFSQIKAKLRKVEFHEDYQGKAEVGDADYDQHKNGYNEDIAVTVNMTVYGSEQVRDKWDNKPTVVYDPGHGYGPYTLDENNQPVNDHPNGETAKETIHVSDEFNSPEQGESVYVHITVSLKDGANQEYRHYYVEIHRRRKEPKVELHYGNSPYGMIMNVDRWSEKAKEDAIKAFDKGYTFRGVPSTNLPDAVNGKLDKVTYWREAWASNEGLFEPESFTSINDFLDPNDFAPNIYSDDDNLDLNDKAFFAVLGQDIREPGVISATDSSGRDVPLYKISARMVGEKKTVNGAVQETGIVLLDTSQTKQVDRFSGGAGEVFIDLGVAGRKLTYKTAGDTLDAIDPQLGVKNWPLVATQTSTLPGGGTDPAVTDYTAMTDLRPGQYLIEYTFTDFDGVSTIAVTRPLVILREVGDVNVDGVRNAGSKAADAGSDEYAIEDRVTNDPLGYEAGTGAVITDEKVYPRANIFKFRVCDVNNDRNINNIDANQVAENVKNGGGWLRFYDSLDYGLTAPEVQAPPAATP